ncbi:MAG TPA: hypothetical protein VHM26_04965 [Chitinophagaceae bacterium]|jgi:hypothetical protein|nr:hypothetical protein [Chitinophagaceae bacterium]
MKLRSAIIILLLVVSATGLAQQTENSILGEKERWVYKIGALKKDSVSFSTDVYDRYGKEMIVGEFILQHLNTDSLLMNQLHNEGAAWLLQYGNNRVTLTLLDMMQENGKYEYPKQFTQTIIDIKQGAIHMYEKNIEAAPLVLYLKKNFKKLRELF